MTDASTLWAEAKTRIDAALVVSSQGQVAAQLGVSPATLSLALNGRYGVDGHRGDLAALAKRAIAKLAEATVTCNALGVIAVAVCNEHQQRARSGIITSGWRATMINACRTCPRYQP